MNLLSTKLVILQIFDEKNMCTISNIDFNKTYNNNNIIRPWFL